MTWRPGNGGTFTGKAHPHRRPVAVTSPDPLKGAQAACCAAGASGRAPPSLRHQQRNNFLILIVGLSHLDCRAAAWPGESLIACARNGELALRRALISAVNDRAPTAKVPDALADLNVEAFVRAKLLPIVRAYFPASEQAAVLEMLGRSVVFLTADNIDAVLHNTPFVGTAWPLANLYLLSLGAEPLSDDAPKIVGFSEGTTCYISTAYFQRESRFEDFLVHEAAHAFHNCKRETIGLPKARGREWLLEIDYRKREMFAYACEAFSRVIALGSTLAARKRLLNALADMTDDHPPYTATTHHQARQVLHRVRGPSRRGGGEGDQTSILREKRTVSWASRCECGLLRPMRRPGVSPSGLRTSAGGRPCTVHVLFEILLGATLLLAVLLIIAALVMTP